MIQWHWPVPFSIGSLTHKVYSFKTLIMTITIVYPQCLSFSWLPPLVMLNSLPLGNNHFLTFYIWYRVICTSLYDVIKCLFMSSYLFLHFVFFLLLSFSLCGDISNRNAYGGFVVCELSLNCFQKEGGDKGQGT